MKLTLPKAVANVTLRGEDEIDPGSREIIPVD